MVPFTFRTAGSTRAFFVARTSKSMRACHVFDIVYQYFRDVLRRPWSVDDSLRGVNIYVSAPAPVSSFRNAFKWPPRGEVLPLLKTALKARRCARRFIPRGVELKMAFSWKQIQTGLHYAYLSCECPKRFTSFWETKLELLKGFEIYTLPSPRHSTD